MKKNQKNQKDNSRHLGGGDFRGNDLMRQYRSAQKR